MTTGLMPSVRKKSNHLPAKWPDKAGTAQETGTNPQHRPPVRESPLIHLHQKLKTPAPFRFIDLLRRGIHL
jgi:hypothetical protein